jgi:hypothetical protein
MQPQDPANGRQRIAVVEVGFVDQTVALRFGPGGAPPKQSLSCGSVCIALLPWDLVQRPCLRQYRSHIFHKALLAQEYLPP